MTLQRIVPIVFAALIAAGGPALAQLPPGVFAGERDPKAAAAGTYKIDPSHTAVIAKVSHIGYALSVFRFDKVEGKLIWNPAEPAKSTLTAQIATASISTPVPGFAHQLAGDDYLKSARFPEARFVSTAFHQTDATHGTVEGQFTLMGITKPLTFDVVLQGAGKGFMGHPRIGIEATAQMDPKDYRMNPVFSAPIIIQIDAEFAEGS